MRGDTRVGGKQNYMEHHVYDELLSETQCLTDNPAHTSYMVSTDAMSYSRFLSALITDECRKQVSLARITEAPATAAISLE